jgi:isopenicillin N synthase-like dioxygenase
MPTPEYFARYPPFPSDVPVAELAHLSLSKLLENDSVESQRLFEASKKDGLFLLNLKGCDEGEVMIKHTENAFVLNEKLFALGPEELRKHPVTMPTNRFGYVLPYHRLS